MNYCSIDDAWGDGKITNQFQKYMNDDVVVEPIKKINQEPVKNTCIASENNIEKFTNNNTNNHTINHTQLTCDDVFNHIHTCKYCYNRLYYKFNVPHKNDVINNLYNIINNNKDTIVIILIGFFIVLFLKLVNDVTNK